MGNRWHSDGLRGSLDLLVLRVLAAEPMHGWGIGQRIQQLSDGGLEVNQGSLYPGLQRLEHRGLITSRWQVTENGRRARYYEITRSGRRAVERELRDWETFTAVIKRFLEAT